MLTYEQWLTKNSAKPSSSMETLYAYYVAEYHRGQLDEVANTSGY